MTTTKFKAKFLQQYVLEIFGNQDVTDPLIAKNLSQKVKFHLKKLGSTMQQEYKNVLEQLQELYKKYSEEVPPSPEEGENTKPKSRIKEEFKDQFLKEVQEIEEMDISIPHEEFSEKDFIDRNTGDIVSGTIYYNLVEILLRWDETEKVA